MGATAMDISHTILDLPDELLLAILCRDVVSVPDVCRVACTCSRLRNICEAQMLWLTKFRQFWPRLWEYLPPNSEINDWHEEVKQVVCFQREVSRLVVGLSRRLFHYSRLTTPVYNEVDVMVLSTPNAPFYIKHALRQIIEDGGELKNLTEKYYALKVMSHIHQVICQREWQEFLAQPLSQQSLEVGAMLMAKWFQPHKDVCVKEMVTKINLIAEKCHSKLCATFPVHPGARTPLLVNSDPLEDSRWDRERCEQVLKCVNQVMFQQLKFAGNCKEYYCLKNSLINEVLSSKQGIPITLSVIYMAVCHRLGLRLEPVNFPSHFLMRWKIPGTSEYRYIDAFDKGQCFSAKEVRSELPTIVNQDDFLSSCSTLEVFQRMIRNIMNVAQMQANISDHMELYCPATEFMSLLTPSDVNVQELLLRIYYTLEIHYDRIVAGCQQLLAQSPSTILEEMLMECQGILRNESCTPKPIVPCERSKDIAFATGLVMQHKRYHYACVVFGWDKECKMPPEWVRRMGVHLLENKSKQPFYNVLVHDGSHRYAAQENLEVATEPIPISHPDVGKYFKEFTGTHYLPNSELKQQYPGDETLRNEILRAKGLL